MTVTKILLTQPHVDWTTDLILSAEQLCLPLAHTRPPTSKQLDYIGEIIDEFVFCEIDRKGAKRKVLS